MIYTLQPTNNQSQKSFYNKAYVLTENGNETLFSYDVKIITRKASGELVRHWNGEKENGDWSKTTGRHIFAFCQLNKKEFLKLNWEV